MVCGLFAMVHLHPHQVAYAIVAIFALELVLHVRKAITGKSSWSLEDGGTASDSSRIES
jgi:hypothetical protein